MTVTVPALLTVPVADPPPEADSRGQPTFDKLTEAEEADVLEAASVTMHVAVPLKVVCVPTEPLVKLVAELVGLVIEMPPPAMLQA